MKKIKPASSKLSLTPPKPAGQMRRTQTAEPEPPTVVDEASLLADLRALIQSARSGRKSAVFQRTALSKSTKAVISSEIANLRDGRMTPDTVFCDPYFLDFLGLKGAYSERDLESAILREKDAQRAITEKSC